MLRLTKATPCAPGSRKALRPVARPSSSARCPFPRVRAAGNFVSLSEMGPLARAERALLQLAEATQAPSSQSKELYLWFHGKVEALRNRCSMEKGAKACEPLESLEGTGEHARPDPCRFWHACLALVSRAVWCSTPAHGLAARRVPDRPLLFLQSDSWRLWARIKWWRRWPRCNAQTQ